LYDQESATHCNYYRNYDPGIGRYVQSDPIGLDGGNNTYAYGENNPITMIDPTGENAVFKIIKLCKNGYVTLRKVGFKDAVRAARRGDDVVAPLEREARKVADAAGGGARDPIKDSPHGPGQNPHFHPNPRTGSHIFYDVAAGLTFSYYFEGCDCAMQQVAPILDFFSPLSTPQDIIDIFQDSE